MGRKTLEEKTQDYWRVSTAYKRGDGPMITMEQAITYLGDIEDTTDNQKRLAEKTTALLDKIIGVEPSKNEVGAYGPDLVA